MSLALRTGSALWRPLLVSVMVLGTSGAAVSIALAQPAIRVARRTAMRVPEEQRPVNSSPAVLHASEEGRTLLSRAREGIEREDWKLVVDSLQRIVELPGEHVLTSDGRVYESARRFALRQIAALPPAGLAAYRLMYDSEAAALLAKATEQHDMALLRDVVDRYLVTQVGEKAGVTLADWLIDEGRFAEAAATLQLVKGIYPGSNLPRWVIQSRLAVCYAGMGRRQRAEAALEELNTPASRPAGSVGEAPTPPKPPLAKGGKDSPPASTGGKASSPLGEGGKDSVPLGNTGNGVRDRLEQVRSYVQRPPKGEDMAEATAWPVAYGRASRDGIMPIVEPSFSDHLPWVVPLNVPEELDGLDKYAQEHKLLPAANMVADGRTLVVKSGPVLQALDIDTFQVLWRREPGAGKDDPAIVEEPSGGGPIGWPVHPQDPGDQLENSATVRRLLRDSVCSGLTIASDLVLTVEWHGDPPNTSPWADQQFRNLPGMGVFSATHPNRIVAYSLKDGHPVWESNTRPGESKLGLVEFLSAPVPVEGFLLAPCRVNTDLYAVVLDPADGRMVRSIYLCGTGGGPFDSLYALQPCVSDGVVYIPTGRGAVIALEASSWSIRWVVRYDVRQTQQGEWLPTPIIAVADSVLVAPSDSDELYCLDRATGETRWHAARGDSSYVLGATDRHVWLGGEQAQLLDVETGERRWTKTVAQPSGRGVVTGERIYAPTATGLIALNAMTGETIDLKQSGDPLMLGNLLAFNNTLYSTDVNATREFPDMERGYAEAVKRHKKDPAEPSAVIRLARLELLRHSPDKALAALEKLPDQLKTSNPRRYEQANHLEVTSMLELASSGDVSSGEARKLLERARQTAVSPQDAVDSALALGEYHRRENRPLEACFQYLSLALSPEGDRVISEGEEFRQRARSVAVRRLGDAAKALAAEESAKLEEMIRRARQQAESNRDASAMLWLGESPALGPASIEAELTLGKWAMEDLRFEQAEGYFRQVIRRGGSQALEAEATARLAALYAFPEDLHLPVSAVRLLDRLEHDYAGVEMPASVLAATDMAGTSTSRPAEDGQRLTGAAAARELRKRIDKSVLARHQEAMGPITVGPVREPTSTPLTDARPLLVRNQRVEPLADEQLVLVDSGSPRVEAQRLADGKVIWPAELKLLTELAVSSRVEEVQQQRQRVYGPGPGPTSPARGLVDGQTLVVNSECGIHAIGLLTGRRLWSRHFDPPAIKSGQERAGSDASLWVHDGYVISVDKSGELQVSLVTSGDRLLWSRRRPGRHWYAVRARGPYVVAVDERLESADIYRLEDGRYLGACQFKQNPAHRVSILVFDDVICGPGGDDEVVAMDLATPGVQRWRVQANANLSQLFKPSADLAAVADLDGGVQLIDPRTGDRQMAQTRVPACAEGITDGTLSGGVLYVCGYKKRGAGDQQRWGLAAIRVQDGTAIWSRDDLGGSVQLNQDVLESAVNAIPVAKWVGDDGGNRQFSPVRASNGRVVLSLLDKGTGKPIGQQIDVALGSEAGASQIVNVEVHPGQVQVTAGAARLRFPFNPIPAPSGGAATSRPATEGESAAGVDAGRNTEAQSP